MREVNCCLFKFRCHTHTGHLTSFSHKVLTTENDLINVPRPGCFKHPVPSIPGLPYPANYQQVQSRRSDRAVLSWNRQRESSPQDNLSPPLTLHSKHGTSKVRSKAPLNHVTLGHPMLRSTNAMSSTTVASCPARPESPHKTSPGCPGDYILLNENQHSVGKIFKIF
jgi:hypothetical protein